MGVLCEHAELVVARLEWVDAGMRWSGHDWLVLATLARVHQHETRTGCDDLVRDSTTFCIGRVRSSSRGGLRLGCTLSVELEADILVFALRMVS